MPDQAEQRRFNVHLFPVIRLLVSDVEADSHRAAVEKALAMTDLYARFEASDGDYAEEISHYLVDVVGDDEYAESWWFYSRQSPFMANFARLVSWYDRGRSDDELDAIIADVRQILDAAL